MIDTKSAWAAFEARDRAQDGRFVGAVRTTGIYCKPSCPARHPKQEHVEFFATPGEARAAGYRACLRCRPDEVGRDRDAVAAAVRLIEAAEEPPRLAELAAAVGYAPHHFHPTGAAASWVRASVDYATGQITQVADDRFETPTTIPRLLLTEVLQLHLSSAPAAQQGFVRALSDPVVGPAMALIHGAPEEKWTVADLATRSNVSVSLLDERFRAVLGMPPIRYLTSWRMHVAQDLLTSTDLGVATIARSVGYESEEAFSRAFKRKFETPPSVWRTRT